MILYKYLSPDRFDVLGNCLIRYTQPVALNDPFEVNMAFDKFASDEETIKSFFEGVPKELKKIYNECSPEIRKRISFESFLDIALLKTPNPFEQFKKILDNYVPMMREMISETFSMKIGILSLTIKPDNMLMWSHYASSHEGFVIGFDSENHFFHRQRSNSDEFGYLRKVIYRNLSDEKSKTMLELNGVDVFLIKDLIWEYEAEWRMLTPLQNKDEIINIPQYPIYLFRYPPSAINSLILGSKMKEENISKILQTLKSSSKFEHIIIKHAQVNTLERKLEILDYPI